MKPPERLTADQISVHLVTDVYRGDHSDATRIAFTVKTGETVADLVQRILNHRHSGNTYGDWESDHIELRINIT